MHVITQCTLEVSPLDKNTQWRTQARLEQARQSAQTAPHNALRGMRHVCCRVALPPVFEGDLVKLLCIVDTVSASAPPDLGAATGRSILQDAAGAGQHPAAQHANVAVERRDQPHTGHDRHAQGKDGAAAAELAAGKRVFVFVDKAVETSAKLRLQPGEMLLVLEPFDVVQVPLAAHPVLLAHVVVKLDS